LRQFFLQWEERPQRCINITSPYVDYTLRRSNPWFPFSCGRADGTDGTPCVRIRKSSISARHSGAAPVPAMGRADPDQRHILNTSPRRTETVDLCRGRSGASDRCSPVIRSFPLPHQVLEFDTLSKYSNQV
jgi:hypothetical protein